VHGPTEIGNKTFIGFRAIVHGSRVGRNCHIGHGAIVEGVVIGDERYVRSGSVIDIQELADALPKVGEKHKEFNREVVDFNKELRIKYHARRVILDKVAAKGNLTHNKNSVVKT
jgi:SulP family sulfate permease